MNPSNPDEAADFLEAAFFGGEELLDQATVDLSVELPLIEGYTLLRLLGEGGFGMVYEAEQRVPIRRRVALKVLRPGHTTRELLARFEQERQVLALLNHPNIAKVFDAGETEDGRPFIAMELVRGQTIDRYAGSLDVEAKVALMRDVCRAVGHAHHKGIIHRDLKPSNLLITREERRDPEPKVIDFGIAKALDGPLSSKVMFTQIRQVVGTPGYMSPERQHTSQISQSADTRADVFALGAILWELVAGETPVQDASGGETVVSLPNAKACPRELRWIVGKATDGDMDRRYANADALADDLGRFLEGSPLVAAPKSSAYLLSKWAKRNRALSIVAVVSMLALMISVILVLRSYREVRLALGEAERSRASMHQTFSHADYLMGMTRARRRPVHAMAQWARALKTDPSNRAALGMLLATWGQRTYVHPISAAVAVPKGQVKDLAVSNDGTWAAVTIDRDDGAQMVARCRRGEAAMQGIEIPADGEITLVAISNDGIVALAGVSGPVGFLHGDGHWDATESEAEGRRGLRWSDDGVLWSLSRTGMEWLDADGRSRFPTVDLPGQLGRWGLDRSQHGLVVGLDGGRLGIVSEPGTEPRVVHAPIPAPMMSVALDQNQDHQTVAAAWRNGDVWVQREAGEEMVFQGEPAIGLQLGRNGQHLAAVGAESFRWIDLAQRKVLAQVPLDRPLRSLAEVRDGLWILTPVYGAPMMIDGGVREDLPGFGSHVRVDASAKGDCMALVDEEHAVLEWLAFSKEGHAIDPLSVKADWVSIVRSDSEGGWRGVDQEGWVSQVHSAGGAIRGWRCSERPIRMASVDASGSAALLDFSGRPQVRVIREGGAVTEIRSGKPSSMALSGDGDLAVIGLPSGESMIFNAKTGELMQQKSWQRGPVTALTFVSPSRIALAFSAQIRIWDWQEDQTLPSILDFSKAINALATDPSGSRLAAAGSGELHVIDIESGLRVVGSLKAPLKTKCVAWEGDGERIWSFVANEEAQATAMPPALERSPPWLPAFVERHIGMHVNDLGRVVRIRSTEPLPGVPDNADPALRAWLRLRVIRQ